MTEIKGKYRDQLDRLAMSLVDDILSMNDKELFAEAKADADHNAREECAEQCEQRANSLREGSAIARQCAKDIQSRIK